MSPTVWRRTCHGELFIFMQNQQFATHRFKTTNELYGDKVSRRDRASRLATASERAPLVATVVKRSYLSAFKTTKEFARIKFREATIFGNSKDRSGSRSIELGLRSNRRHLRSKRGRLSKIASLLGLGFGRHRIRAATADMLRLLDPLATLKSEDRGLIR